jgi:putative ABC transport system ATP-binding protein
MIRIENLDFRYPARDNGFTLRISSFRMRSHERLAVIGPSGTGKTTLLKLIAGIVPPDRGAIWVDGQGVHAMGDTARRNFRISRLGFVFQDLQLLDYLNMADNILHPYRINPSLRLTAQVRQRLERLADDLGIREKLTKPVTSLSQGERQRAAICRAVLPGPALILADEPTASLDPENKQKILDVLFCAVESQKSSLITVTHDHELIRRFDRVLDFSTFR